MSELIERLRLKYSGPMPAPDRETVLKDLGIVIDALGLATTEVGRLEKLVYLAGHWSCPKCDFYLVSTNLHVPSGGFSANREPQACANGCGPMWRVTHEQSANRMVDRCGKQADRIKQIEAAATYLSAEVKDGWDLGRISVDTFHAALAMDNALVIAGSSDPRLTKQKEIR